MTGFQDKVSFTVDIKISLLDSGLVLGKIWERVWTDLEKPIKSTWEMFCSVKQQMKPKTITILGLMAVMAITLGGLGFAYAQTDETTCLGTGPQSLLNARGFWGTLTEDQRVDLYDSVQTMVNAGALPEEIQAMKAARLAEWGIETPNWRGPHEGESGPHGDLLKDGTASGVQFGAHGGMGYDGVCPYTTN